MRELNYIHCFVFRNILNIDLQNKRSDIFRYFWIRIALFSFITLSTVVRNKKINVNNIQIIVENDLSVLEDLE